MLSQLITRLKRTGYGLLGLLLALLMAMPGWSQATSPFAPIIEEEAPLRLGPSQVSSSLTAPGLSDRAEFETFIDNFFTQAVQDKTIPGGVMAVVKDGEVFFAKGYGYADLERQVPVNVDTTRFRVASLSKLFTTTATMQLQATGQLRLADDIRPYLGDRVELRNPFPEPVTFAQLMTHTDGSTKRRIGLAAATEAQMQSLETYLADHLPPIVYPPGTLFSYSSHSIALLGYLVQQIAGQPFVEYIDEHILQPLKMSHSSFAQPPPQQEALATGYRKRGNQFQPVPYLYLNIGPAAALSSTATDMAHFMIAQLRGGQYKNERILPSEAIADMQRIHFRPHPDLPGTGYGFRERRINGRRVIGHLGSLRGYSSSLTLMPEEQIGIFVASNSFSGIHSQLLRQFFDRYFPASPEPARAIAPPPQYADQLDLDRFVGTYRDLEYPHHTIAKLSAPYERIVIRRTPTGLQIQTPSLFFRQPRSPSQLEPLTPLLFRQPENGTLTAFAADEAGHIRYAYNPVFAKMGTFAKIAWYENLWLHLTIVVAAGVLFLSSLWLWPVRPAVRRLRDQLAQAQLASPWAWQIASLVSALNLVFLIGFPLALWLYGGWKLAYGMPWFGTAFLVLPLLSAVLTLPLLGITLWSWRQKDWRLMQRWHYTLLAIATSLLTAIFGYWRVLGFQF